MEGEFNTESLFIACISEMHTLLKLLKESSNSWSFENNKIMM